MFLGSTGQIICRYLSREMAFQKSSNVFCMFAGNFVIEQVAAKSRPGALIHSTDVSLYSRAIGMGITDQDFTLELKEEWAKDFQFLLTKKKPLEKAAVVVFFSEVAVMIMKKKIDYYRHQYIDAVAHQEKYFQDVYLKLQNLKNQVQPIRFYGVDACNLVPLVKEGDFVYYDPPNILGGYEKMFKQLSECFHHDEVPYTTITNDIIAEHLTRFDQAGATALYRSTNEAPFVPPPFKLVFNYNYKWGMNWCIYANKNHETFVGKFTPLKEEVKNYPIIGMEDVITENSRIELIRVKTTVGNHYRLMWVKKARMVNGSYAFLVTVDKKVIGMLLLNGAQQVGSDLAVIFSDPAAPSSRYKRLSKLLTYICCTRTVLKLINDLTMWEHTGFTTAVFTNEVVSMRYRGMFELAKREKLKNAPTRHKLIYQNRKNIFKNYNKALKAWLKEYGNVTTNTGSEGDAE